MVILVPILCLAIGVCLALLFPHPFTGTAGQYLAVACLAGLDTICGGVRSGLEGKFRNDVFISGFVSNIAIAFILAFIGDKIFINLFLAVALVLGARIFNNLSLIRRYGLTRFQDARERRRLEKLAREAQAQAAQTNTALSQADTTA